MAFFSDLDQRLALLREVLGGDLRPERLPVVLDRLDDDDIVAVIAAATEFVRAGEKVRIAAAGVAAARSAREAGHDGLAQRRGHRSPATLIQEITGATRAEAVRHVRLGESLRSAAGLDPVGEEAVTDAAAPTDPRDGGAGPEPWHAPLGRALLAGVIGSAQHDAIYRGLGEPPAFGDDDVAARAAREAWTVAAEQLIDEARERTVEELGRTARTVRDQLDPEGAQRRFDERFDARSFRLWRDAEGVRRGSIVFDDFGGAWAQTVLDAALRPRRGGPRFVDPEEKADADALVADPRTNDQLAYDLLLDVFRAGALADGKEVFGTRQAGVRVVIADPSLAAATAGAPAVGLIEDDQTALPAWLMSQHACDSGSVTCTIDGVGNPLDVGREARLFTPKQRIALAARDGGCRWRGCDRPASYCEAHHIDPYAGGGRTDIDRGILLCRFHHMELHHGGWRITREGRADFMLHPPPGRGHPIALRPRLALRYAWADLSPPPRRFRPAAA
ncbi:HNH endonuclease signature motif containing protein [Microbacterium gallinarum]|uniref:DUF222 domain-containing protein n=1 Tax=Microbacterium gallinarum TaxID=2762209 RepID=A0ABR8X619_9MICO|nr:HNH endonuclease signature motif containing protein [Microbacterium gallinarum]MBD8024766.1 DUF222 domain-containing protein [Microbacterium gallinarum]